MRRNEIVFIVLAILAVAKPANAQEPATIPLEQIKLDSGIELSYIEAGRGVPVIFIHGTLGDLYMWTDFVAHFGNEYRAIAYSRRYNYPNENPIQPNLNHSTAIEAHDLAAFIKKLQLSKAHIVGYSYGGYTALHLTVNHPEMVRTLVLAEPPLVPWLSNQSENQDEGKRLLLRQKTRFIDPARKALDDGDEEGAVRIFIDYVIRDGAFDQMPKPAKKSLLRNTPEFVAEVTSENMFAPLTRQQVSAIAVPTLLLSGQNSVGILQLTDAELEHALPAKLRKRVFIPNATHAMWHENRTACTLALSDFLESH